MGGDTDLVRQELSQLITSVDEHCLHPASDHGGVFLQRVCWADLQISELNTAGLVLLYSVR